MLYTQIHTRTGRRSVKPVTEQRVLELKASPVTAGTFRFELVKESALNTVPLGPTGAVSAKKPKTKKQETVNDEQDIDSGDSSEPLQEN